MAPLMLWCILAFARGAELHLDRIKLPPGFQIEAYAEQAKNAREMALGPSTNSLREHAAGRQRLCLGRLEHQNKADRVFTIGTGLQNPNRDGALYVAERSRVVRYDDIQRRLDRCPLNATNSWTRSGQDRFNEGKTSDTPRATGA